MRYRRVSLDALMIFLMPGALLAAGCREAGDARVVPPEDRPGSRALTLDRIHSDPPLDGARVREVHWAGDGSRVGYLRPGAGNRDVLELWVVEPGSGAPRLLASAERLAGPGGGALSESQTQALERKRMTERGITGYAWSEDGKSALVPLGEALYVVDAASGGARLLYDGKDGPPMDPAWSPDGRLVSMVLDGEVAVAPSGGGDPATITSGAGGTVTHGLAEFIAQEEMGRYLGYWWSPDSSLVAFMEVDESGVETSSRATYGSTGDEVSTQRYPAAGKANARTRVGIASSGGGETTWIDAGPGAEYVARVAWLPDGSRLAVQVQPRDQGSLSLLLVDPATGKAATVLTDESETWVDLHDDLVFLEDGSGFLWPVNEGDARRIWLHDMTGRSVRPITGEGVLVSEIECLDLPGGRLFYSADVNHGLERQLFAVGLGGGEASSVTTEPGWHEIEMAPGCGSFVDVHSTAVDPPRVTLRADDGRDLAVIMDDRAPDLGELARARPEFLEVRASDGETSLNAVVTRPIGGVEGRRLPVVVYVYGGPGGRVVADRWGSSSLWNQYLASRGYAVFSVDPRGGDGRGKRFAEAIHRGLGKVEVDDVTAAVRWLASQPWVDGSRIGIWGWSYGGTMVVMSLLRTEGLYRSGVAVAPVTDWRRYDTHYTERYLGMPGSDPGTYAAASLVDQDPAGIAEDLLIVHGMADDNVFLANSLSFMDRLQQAGITFDLMLYPGKTHLIAGKKARLHLYRTISKYLDRTLGS